MNYKILREWFYFSKKERNAVLILALVLLLFFLIPYFSPKQNLNTNTLKTSETIIPNSPVRDSESGMTHLFYFDPNTITENDWRKLGLREKTILTIIHYRQKGGIFHRPEDIRKIYGLSKIQADQLIPYISIPKSQQVPSDVIPISSPKTSSIEINTASQEKWAQLPGISDYIAARIVHYRSAIHGFKSIEQVANTYGFTPKLLEQIKPFLRMSLSDQHVQNTIHQQDSFTEKKTVREYLNVSKSFLVNINSASEAELINTRGISKSVAKAIIIYREQHGDYHSIEDIRKIVFITPEMYERIKPLIFVK